VDLVFQVDLLAFGNSFKAMDAYYRKPTGNDIAKIFQAFGGLDFL
jgi:hypothetical protein